MTQFVSALIIAAALCVEASAAWAQASSVAAGQPKSSPSESPLMRQVQQALMLASRGDKQGAMNLVSRLLDEHPNYAPALRLKGLLLEQSGHSAEAAAAYDEALKFAPNDPDLLLQLGTYKLKEGQNQEALRLLEHCVRISPNDGDAQYYLAQAYHLNGQDERALAAIRNSVKAESDNPSVLQKYGELLCINGDCKSALRWLLKAQHADASLSLIDYDVALANYKLMDLTNAAPYALRAVQAQPNNLSALQLLSDVETKLAHWQEARQAFQQTLALKPNDAESLMGLGQCDVELKDYPAAVETLQLLLRLAPTRPLAHFYLSKAYAGMGKTADAEHEAALHHLMMEQLTFGQSLENEDRERPIRDQAYQLLIQHREEDALQLYRQRFQGTPATEADAHVFVGKLYLFGGNSDDAVRCLHRALEIQATVRGAHTYEGILALKKDDLPVAENEFKTELANDPNYQLAIAEMGEVRYRQERWADAAELLAKSRTSTPEFLYMLCDSYFHIGKVEDADLNAETAAAYGRNKPELMKQLNVLLIRNGQEELAERLGRQ